MIGKDRVFCTDRGVCRHYFGNYYSARPLTWIDKAWQCVTVVRVTMMDRMERRPWGSAIMRVRSRRWRLFLHGFILQFLQYLVYLLLPRTIIRWVLASKKHCANDDAYKNHNSSNSSNIDTDWNTAITIRIIESCLLWTLLLQVLRFRISWDNLLMVHLFPTAWWNRWFWGFWARCRSCRCYGRICYWWTCFRRALWNRCLWGPCAWWGS
jgi:hypothetical protein